MASIAQPGDALREHTYSRLLHIHGRLTDESIYMIAGRLISEILASAKLAFEKCGSDIANELKRISIPIFRYHIHDIGIVHVAVVVHGKLAGDFGTMVIASAHVCDPDKALLEWLGVVVDLNVSSVVEGIVSPKESALRRWWKSLCGVMALLMLVGFSLLSDPSGK